MGHTTSLWAAQLGEFRTNEREWGETMPTTGMVRTRWGLALFVALLAAIVVFGSVSAAFAGTVTTWSGLQPTGVTTSKPIIATGRTNTDGKPLVAASLKLYVDDMLIPRPSYTASVLPTYVYVYYSPVPALGDGAHTYRVEVSDTAGKLSSKQWSSTLAQPPSATWLSPAPGSTVYSGRPRIVMSLADNTPSTTFTVAGEVRSGSSAGPVVATFGATGLSAGLNTFSVSDELVFGTYHLTATVTDAAGNVRQLTGATARSFTAISAPAMTVLESCDSCHAATRAAHPTPAAVDCGVCHPNNVGDHMEGTDYCEDCHYDGWHNPGGASVTVTGSCTSCHSSARPDVVRHTASSTSVAHESSCGGCHYGTLITQHAATPVGSSYAYQCDMCHGSTDAPVQAAIMTENTSCVACHLDGFHEGFDEKHTYSGMDAGCQGAGCHVAALVDAHAAYVGEGKRYQQYPDTCALCHSNEDPSRVPVGATADCASCHPSADHETPHIASVTPACAGSGCHSATSLTSLHINSDTTLSCGSCHTSEIQEVQDAITGGVKDCTACHSASSPHGDLASVHAIPADKAACLESGCHDGSATVPFTGRGVDELHADATITVADVTRTSCGICHISGVTPTTDCLTSGCHADRAEAHGYPPEAHVATESCVLSCHAPLQGLTELKPVHDALTTPVACTGCHPAKVDAVTPWDKTCTACHRISDLHQAQAADHVGTDVAYQDASFFGGGCSDNTAHTDQFGCHDIANVANLHSRMPGNGCAVCHGDGKTPAQECLDCHQIGSATTYTKPGTVTNGVLTASPSSDASITPGWTWTTNPTGQPRYAVVNTPYPPASTARFMTVTSSSAGGVLFGFDRPSIPANAKIVSVRVYAKAKATNTTYPRRMNGWLSIGGQTYLSSNQTGTLPSSGFLGGTGAGTAFSTSPTRVDYTREPLYGETIWLNPKTGADWTPAQLNAPGPDSLDAFGVYLTQSTAANNVSLAQIYVSVSYYTMTEPVAFPTVGTHTYHVNNVKYLHDPSDAPAGQRFAVNPAHGWYDALFYQDCYDFCHRGNGPTPTFSAHQGTWMWYSVGGDPYDSIAATRTLALKPVTVPTDSPTLAFTTNYQLETGATGYVEISTDDGGVWTPLTGTVGGAATSSLTGNSSGWVPASYDLSAYAGQSAKLRFRYVNGASQGAGWAFDSLTIGGAGGPVFSDDAETLKPDWTNTYWTRANGAFPF